MLWFEIENLKLVDIGYEIVLLLLLLLLISKWCELLLWDLMKLLEKEIFGFMGVGG